MAARKTLKQIKKEAKKVSLIFLPQKYTNCMNKHKYKCMKAGHILEKTPNNVQKKRGCPICNPKKRKTTTKTIKQAQTTAKKAKLKFLSKKYTTTNTKYKYRCNAKGHTFYMKDKYLVDGRSCPHCTGKKDTIKEAKETAKKRGYKILDKKYKGLHTPHTYKCQKGHTFQLKPHNFKYYQTQCPTCKKQKKHEKLKKHAAKKAMTLNTPTYLGSLTKHTFTCQKGHKIKTTPTNLYAIKYCPQCSPKNKTTEQLQTDAKKVNAKYTDTKYKGYTTKHKYTCQKGHTWMARPSSIHQGHGCPTCWKTTKKKKPRAAPHKKK
jgi:hypothetical protein